MILVIDVRRFVLILSLVIVLVVVLFLSGFHVFSSYVLVAGAVDFLVVVGICVVARTVGIVVIFVVVFVVVIVGLYFLALSLVAGGVVSSRMFALI